MKSVVPLSTRERLAQAFQEECLTIRQCALIIQVSPKTIRRRLPLLTEAGYVVRVGRVVRIRRLGLLKLFGAQ